MYQGDAEHETVARYQGSGQDPRVCQWRHGFAATRADKFCGSTGCDGIMIGRAAQGRPWIFDEVNFFLSTGELRAVWRWKKSVILCAPTSKTCMLFTAMRPVFEWHVNI